jgi:hypothetical protein
MRKKDMDFDLNIIAKWSIFKVLIEINTSDNICLEDIRL